MALPQSISAPYFPLDCAYYYILPEGVALSSNGLASFVDRITHPSFHIYPLCMFGMPLRPEPPDICIKRFVEFLGRRM